MNNTDPKAKKREDILWLAMIPQIGLVAISIIWILIEPKNNIIKYFDFKIEHVIFGILVGLGLALAGYVFYIVTKKTNVFNETTELFEKMLAPTFNNLYVIDIILLSFIAGVCEEIFFRGLLQQAWGIAIASIAFGLLHFPGLKYWFYALWAAMSGAILGVLLIVTNSLWTPIVAHAINNIVGMFILRKLKQSS